METPSHASPESSSPWASDQEFQACEDPGAATPTLEAAADTLIPARGSSKAPSQREVWTPLSDTPSGGEAQDAQGTRGADSGVSDWAFETRLGAKAGPKAIRVTTQHDPSGTERSAALTTQGMELGQKQKGETQTFEHRGQTHTAESSQGGNVKVGACSGASANRSNALQGGGGPMFDSSKASVHTELGVDCNGFQAGSKGAVMGTLASGMQVGIEASAHARIEEDRVAVGGSGGLAVAGKGGTRGSINVGAHQEKARNYGAPQMRPDGRWQVPWQEQEADGGSFDGGWSGVTLGVGGNKGTYESGTEVFDSEAEAKTFADAKRAPAVGPDLEVGELLSLPVGTVREAGDTSATSGSLGAAGGTGGMTAGISGGDTQGLRLEVIGEGKVLATLVSAHNDAWQGGLAAPLASVSLSPQEHSELVARFFEIDVSTPDGQIALRQLQSGEVPDAGSAVIDRGEQRSDTDGQSLKAGIGPISWNVGKSVTHSEDAHGVKTVEAESHSEGAAGLIGFNPRAQSTTETVSLDSVGQGSASASASGTPRSSAEDLATFSGSSANWLAYVDDTMAPNVKIEKRLPPAVWHRLTEQLLAGHIQTSGRAGAALVAALREADGEWAACFEAWQVFIGTGQGSALFEIHVRNDDAEQYLSVDGMSQVGGAEMLQSIDAQAVMSAERAVARQQDPGSAITTAWRNLRERERQLLQVEKLATVPPGVCDEELERTRDLIERAEALLAFDGEEPIHQLREGTLVQGQTDFDCGEVPRQPVSMEVARAQRLYAHTTKGGAMRRLHGLHQGGIGLRVNAPIPRAQIGDANYKAADRAWEQGLAAMARADVEAGTADEAVGRGEVPDYSHVVTELVSAQLSFEETLAELDRIETSSPQYFPGIRAHVGGAVCGD